MNSKLTAKQANGIAKSSEYIDIQLGDVFKNIRLQAEAQNTSFNHNVAYDPEKISSKHHLVQKIFDVLTELGYKVCPRDQEDIGAVNFQISWDAV